MSYDQNYKKLKQTMHMINVASLGLNLQKDIKEEKRKFLLLQQNVDLELLLEPEALAPVLLSMADMLYESASLDNEFKTFQPIKLVKRDSAICCAIVKPDDNYSINQTGFSLAMAGLCLIDVMDNLFHPNSKNQIILDHTVKIWRTELAEYKEGQVIDIRKHREALFEGNLNPFPKVRLDLQDEKKSKLKNEMFS